jgi:alpha-beta hydrolase superfamily lysophospholipase
MTVETLATEGSFTGAEGYRIFTRSWAPPTGSPRAVLVIVHGFNSHSGHYLWAGEQFARGGLAVYAIDLRGRGRSEGARYHIDNIDDYTRDVDTLVEQARAEHQGLPVFRSATVPAG